MRPLAKSASNLADPAARSAWYHTTYGSHLLFISGNFHNRYSWCTYHRTIHCRTDLFRPSSFSSTRASLTRSPYYVMAVNPSGMPLEHVSHAPLIIYSTRYLQRQSLPYDTCRAMLPWLTMCDVTTVDGRRINGPLNVAGRFCTSIVSTF